MTASMLCLLAFIILGLTISLSVAFDEFRILKADEQYKVLKVGTAVVGCLLLIVAVCSAMYRWSRTPKAGDKADKCRCRPDTRDDSEDVERSKLPPSVLPMLRAAEVSREVNTKFV
uniref:FXYD domain-containing ion transport regulator n=1 Tax=Panagrellus redivivus TaxID=6233 RepID=A0A7E4VDN3_PANRE